MCRYITITETELGPNIVSATDKEDSIEAQDPFMPFWRSLIKQLLS